MLTCLTNHVSPVRARQVSVHTPENPFSPLRFQPLRTDIGPDHITPSPFHPEDVITMMTCEGAKVSQTSMPYQDNMVDRLQVDWNVLIGFLSSNLNILIRFFSPFVV